MLRRRSSPSGGADGGDGVLDLPGYTDLTVIGTGSSGMVYRAYQPRLDRVVAIKVVQADLSGGDLLARWERECRATGRLSRHPSIVTVLDAGVSPAGRPYLVMDWYPQGSLAASLQAHGPMPVPRVLSLGVRLCGALETAHRAGILHRDVKPENVLLDELGEPALADFGIAGIVGSSTAQLGPRALTPVHAAPEILDDRPASPASDVYALGSVLYAALAGRAAYEAGAGEGLVSLFARVVQQPLPPIGRPDVPSELEESVAWAMAKDPSERPGSAAALGQRLQQVQVQRQEPPTDLVITAPARTELGPPNGGQAVGGRTVSREARREPLPAGDPAPIPEPIGEPPPPLSGPGNTGTVARPARGGRVVEPSPEPPREPPRRWVRWVVAGAAGVAVAVIGVVVAAAIGGGQAPSPPTTTVVVNRAQTPTDLTLTVLGPSSVQLRWRDHAGGRYPYVVLYDPPPPDGHQADGVPLGATSYLATVRPNQRTCFRVALVNGPEAAWPVSSQVCTKP